KALADVRALQGQHDDAARDLKEARRYLTELPRAVTQPEQRALYEEATAAIRAELHPESLGRLESFLRQARQAERPGQEGQKADVLDAAQLLSLAVTGWLQGNTAAEIRFDVARKMWRTRQFVLKYLRTAAGGDRQQLLEDYQKEKSDTVGVDELAQMI